MKRIYTLFCFCLAILLFPFHSFSQTFWTENFNNGCNANCLATAWVGPNGSWTQTITGAEGSDPNLWYISCAENGHTNNVCGTGCVAQSPTATLASLHVGSHPNSLGDIGAAYDAGGLCGFWTCPQTDKRIESPTINCTGYNNITLAFNYIENGQGSTDNMTLWYYNGSVWAQLSDPAKTLTNCPNSQGRWIAYSITLPASANNNPNVKIGFRWVNNDDGVGTDPSFAVDDITLSVVSGAPPVAAFTASATNICAGACISFTDQSTNGPTSWSWTFTGATPNSSTAQNPTNICYNTPGTYAVTLTATNANGSSTLTQSTYITVNALPSANAGSNTSICTGSSTVLNASGGTTYTWSPATGLSATTGASPTASPTATTTYTVTVANAAGCTATATVTVTVNALPNASAGSNTAICNGGSTVLNASGGTTYAWSPATGLSATTGASPTASPTATTTYTVTVTDANGCTANASVTITVNPLPNASAGSNTTICSGNNTVLNASGGTSYAWSPATGLSATTGASPTASPTATTTYTVTVSDANGCTANASVTITVNPLPNASAGNSVTICTGNNTTLNASGGTSYAWSPATGLSATTGASPVASPTTTTTYTVTVTDANGCSDTAQVTVTVQTSLTANAGNPVSICQGSNTQLNASGGNNYTWTPSTGLSSTTVSNPIASPTVTTTYTVTVSSGSCSSTASVTVTVNPNPTANAGNPAAICSGSSTPLNASGGISYSWSPSTGLSSTTVSNPSASPTATTTYIVTVTDASGCTDTASVTVVVNPPPTVSAGGNITICNGSNTQLTATGGISYAWSPAASLSASTGNSVNASPTITTTYTVVITDANGCSDTAQVTVTVQTCAGPIPVINSSSPTVCDGSCINFTDASTGAPTSWTWTFQGGTPATSNLQNPGQVCFTGVGPHNVTLTVSNANGTNTTTTSIFVNSVPTATADTSQTIDMGESVVLNATGGGTYSWAPSTGLSCTTCANPTASPTVTTTYTVFVSQNGCTSSDTVTITVNSENELWIASAFSPNGDGMNDFLFVHGKGINFIQFIVYDRWGEKLFETNDIQTGWDGTYKGQPLNTGIYVYYVNAGFISGEVKVLKGDVSLIR